MQDRRRGGDTMYNVEAKLQPTEYNARSTNNLSAAEIYPSCVSWHKTGDPERPRPCLAMMISVCCGCVMWWCGHQQQMVRTGSVSTVTRMASSSPVTMDQWSNQWSLTISPTTLTCHVSRDSYDGLPNNISEIVFVILNEVWWVKWRMLSWLTAS